MRAICRTASSPKWWRRWSAAVRAAYPKLSHRYYALKAKWFGKKTLPHWDRNAPLPKVAQRTISWIDARATVLTAYGAFSPKMAEVADRFFEKRWIDAARAAAASSRAPSRIRPCPRRILMCCSTTRASRAT